MKKISPLYVTLALLSIFSGALSSCCKTANCTPGYASISFVGYNLQEADSFYLRRYKPNTNFGQKLDTAIYKKGQSFLIYEIRGDTLIATPLEPSSSKKEFFVEAGFDYELVMPAIGKVSRITNVTMANIEKKFCGMAKRLCYTQIKSAKVDGVGYSGVLIKK